MLARAPAHATLPRPLNIGVALGAMPPVGSAGAVTARVTRLPEGVGQYRASLFVRLRGSNALVGPAPGCDAPDAMAQLVADPGDATSATVTFPAVAWAANNPGERGSGVRAGPRVPRRRRRRRCRAAARVTHAIPAYCCLFPPRHAARPLAQPGWTTPSVLRWRCICRRT
jgi:hypothetical protein